jgi:hypothetical protein
MQMAVIEYSRNVLGMLMLIRPKWMSTQNIRLLV